jgi:hypothetical protein
MYNILGCTFCITLNTMKQTVYIPDDLLEQAQALLPSVNVSKLIQRGLAQLVDDFQGPIYADAGIDDVAGELERLRAHFANEAKDEYQRGYRKALRAADSLSLRLLEELAENHHDLKRALRPYVNGALQDAMNFEPISSAQVTELLENRVKIVPLQSKDGASPTASPWSWLSRLAEDLGSMADPVGVDEFSFNPTRAFLRGYGDALHDVWSSVEEGGGHRSRRDPKKYLADERGSTDSPNGDIS